MTPINSNFFSVGGSMKIGSPSYLERKADQQLFTALSRGEFCFVLDSRQKGKSSLIIHSLAQLNAAGITTLKIDLQRTGSNLQPEQWYGGLLHAMGKDLGLTTELFDYWKGHIGLGPMARFFGALEEVILNRVTAQVVVFIDEVDFIQSLPFSTDEFFAGIRECYNRRSTNVEFDRLTFCLAGVATPSQLIQNEDITPFNVGTRIELYDFTREELVPYEVPLSEGGRSGSQIVDRIHWWSGGHPYLTQLIAARCMESSVVRGVGLVDEVVRSSLLDPDSRQREPNVADTERRMLEFRAPVDRQEELKSRVLETYRRMLQGKAVPASEDAEVISALLLSGVAVEKAGSLVIRNRIYRTLFDEAWRKSSLPNREAQRQRAASNQAAWKTGRILASLCLVLAAFASYLFGLTRQRDQALERIQWLNNENRRIAYQSSMALASEKVSEGNFLKAGDLVRSQNNSPERNWEWRFWTACLGEPTLIRPPDPDPQAAHRSYAAWTERSSVIEVIGNTVLADGRRAGTLTATVNLANKISWLRSTRERSPLTVRIESANRLFLEPGNKMVDVSLDAKSRVVWTRSRRGIDVLRQGSRTYEHFDTDLEIVGCRLSHNSRTIAISSPDNHASLLDLDSKSWKWKHVLSQVGQNVFSPDDSRILILQLSPDAAILNSSTGRVLTTLTGNYSTLASAVWTHDGKQLLTGGTDGSVRIWDVGTGTQIRAFMGSRDPIDSIDLDVADRRLLAITQNKSVYEWRLDARSHMETLNCRSGKITAMQMSADGSRCVTSSVGGESVLIDVAQAKVIGRYDLGAETTIHPMSFSADSSSLALVATNGETLWVDAKSGRLVNRIEAGLHPAFGAGFDRKGALILSIRNGGLVSLPNPTATPAFHPIGNQIFSRVTFSPNRNLIAAMGRMGKIWLLNAISFEVISQLETDGKELTDVEISPNGRWLVATSRDFNVSVFPLDGHYRRRVLKGHSGRVWAVRFSPDGSRILTNSFDNTARVWDIETGKSLSVILHSSWVSSANWSPDGKRIITASADNLAHIYDARDGFELMKLSGHRDIVFDAYFTPDGKTVVTDCGDGSVRFWRTSVS